MIREFVRRLALVLIAGLALAMTGAAGLAGIYAIGMYMIRTAPLTIP